jgi:hypothetical protein
VGRLRAGEGAGEAEVSESDFAKTVVRRLALQGCRVLRICDGTDSRHGNYGLRALTSPAIHATGADYLVIPYTGMTTVLARDWDARMDKFARTRPEPWFLELKDPEARVTQRGRGELEQQKWIDWVGGKR